MNQDLKRTISEIAKPGVGILAADESAPTISKRLQAVNVESTEDNRRRYRELLFTTPGLGDFVKGIILYDETLRQKAKNGMPFPELLAKNNIIPGIKVDQGLVNLPNSLDEKMTQGLDNLAERLAEYKKLGARFAKWRAVYTVDAERPSRLALEVNAENLARYASLCQAEGIVPIVEPEVLIDGSHTLDQCAVASEKALHEVFHALHRHGVILEAMILKPSMVISGKQCSKQATAQEVADATIRILKRTVPAAVPTVNFLSGGQTPEQASQHLHLMNADNPHLPWNLSFSYARALQEPCMDAWRGKDENLKAAQNALLKRARLNSMAAMGEYQNSMEKAA